MVNCDNCLYYDKEYDEMVRSGQDIIFAERKPKDIHFCPLYPKGIEESIFENKKRCPKFKSKGI